MVCFPIPFLGCESSGELSNPPLCLAVGTSSHAHLPEKHSKREEAGTHGCYYVGWEMDHPKRTWVHPESGASVTPALLIDAWSKPRPLCISSSPSDAVGRDEMASQESTPKLNSVHFTPCRRQLPTKVHLCKCKCIWDGDEGWLPLQTLRLILWPGPLPFQSHLSPAG